MSFSNITQNPPLGTAPIEALDSWYASIENLTAEGDASSLNIPYLSAISLALGNAYTKAISQNCIVFCEPEWGFDITGAGVGSMYGNGGIGSGEGGLYVSW